jgi:thiol-disulfide isomerase/thioredoxin
LVLGGALGLLWTPCAGPILASITTLIATQSATVAMVGLILAYVIGASIPLFLIIWGSGKVIQRSKYLSGHLEGVRVVFGVMTILVAIVIALHWDMVIEQKIALIVPAALIDNTPEVQNRLNELHTSSLPETLSYRKAPELDGATHWINSPPLSIDQLKGKVVLIDFWTYTCINCLRTLPYIKDWYAKYKDRGLVVIGVHTPEFEFEKKPSNVEEAVTRLGITYPVAQDNSYAIWEAYQNHFWPAHYLIDQNGNIVLTHFGEGGYAEMEAKIRELLNLPPISSHEPSVTTRAISPETYLGSNRGPSYTSENAIVYGRTVLYAYPRPLQLNAVGLKGRWKIEDEKIVAEGDDCFLDYHFIGKQVYLVLSGAGQQPMSVFLDGRHVKNLTIEGDRKYDIVDTAYGQHQLSLKIPEGISAYAFTFGDE